MAEQHWIEESYAENIRLRVENERLLATLWEAHDNACGCDQPGNTAKCIADPVFGDVLEAREERSEDVRREDG